MIIKAGKLDKPEMFVVNLEIWTESKVPRVEIGPNVESFPKGRT